MENVMNGDVILVSRKFEITIGGIVQMGIRFFQNLIYVITFQWKKVSIFHHAASVVRVNGELVVYEAIEKGYVNSGSVYDYISDPTIHKYIIRRLKTNFDDEKYIDVQNSMLGTKYWYSGTLGYQVIKQLTLDLVWLGGSPKDRFYCSHSWAYAAYCACASLKIPSKVFKRYFATDPQDIYVSKGLFTIPK